MAWIPGARFCFGRLLSAHSVVFMYLTGFFAAQAAQASSLEAPAWAYANPIPELAVLGRHALPFYLLHQPVILGVLELVYSVR
ncbi:MAG: heparan-alpha-glucosaminide N-acetyltransferase domain-containing protein [Collinsella sp.]|nr:heparan-alpha-glucosaminide N-acetyltransferase domain-containing protein [Collinsella sp.]